MEKEYNILKGKSNISNKRYPESYFEKETKTYSIAEKCIKEYLDSYAISSKEHYPICLESKYGLICRKNEGNSEILFDIIPVEFYLLVRNKISNPNEHPIFKDLFTSKLPSFYTISHEMPKKPFRLHVAPSINGYVNLMHFINIMNEEGFDVNVGGAKISTFYDYIRQKGNSITITPSLKLTQKLERKLKK